MSMILTSVKSLVLNGLQIYRNEPTVKEMSDMEMNNGNADGGALKRRNEMKEKMLYDKNSNKRDNRIKKKATICLKSKKGISKEMVQISKWN